MVVLPAAGGSGGSGAVRFKRSEMWQLFLPTLSAFCPSFIMTAQRMFAALAPSLDALAANLLLSAQW